MIRYIYLGIFKVPESMTKLLEWLSLAAVVGLVWAGAYTDTLLPQYKTQLLWSPVILVLLFGLFSVVTIIYRWRCLWFIVLIINAFACRVATFNDCEDAAKELQKQIGEAREDLRNKGFNFEDKPEKKTDWSWPCHPTNVAICKISYVCFAFSVLVTKPTTVIFPVCVHRVGMR